MHIAITDATHTVGTTADRASFSIALNTARDQLILAAGVIADTTIDLVGTIGRAVLDHLLPTRRQRTSPRIVKRAISKHRAKGTIGAVADTEADLLFRCKTNRKLPVTGRCGDGSWLTRIGATTVRVITMLVHQCGGPTRTEHYLLITTLTDEKHYPATDLVALYHQRWEIETSYLELKSTILGGRGRRQRSCGRPAAACPC